MALGSHALIMYIYFPLGSLKFFVSSSNIVPERPFNTFVVIKDLGTILSLFKVLTAENFPTDRINKCLPGGQSVSIYASCAHSS